MHTKRIYVNVILVIACAKSVYKRFSFRSRSKVSMATDPTLWGCSLGCLNLTTFWRYRTTLIFTVICILHNFVQNRILNGKSGCEL